MTLVSSEPGIVAGGRRHGTVVAAVAHRRRPARSRSSPRPPTCNWSRLGGGGSATDGDLLVADVARNTLRRVTMVDDGVRPAVGAHSGPQLSDTGRTVVFDTLAAAQLVPGSPPGRQVVTTVSPPTLSLAEADLGTTLVGFTSDEWYVAVNNDGPTTFTPSTVSVSDARFGINEEQSTCALGAPVPPGGDCTVRLTFTPTSPGPVTATLTVAETGFQAVVGVDHGARRRWRPDVAHQSGRPGARLGRRRAVRAPSSSSTSRTSRWCRPRSRRCASSARNPCDFVISSNSCESALVESPVDVLVGVVFTPTAAGQRTAVIELATPTGSTP